VGNESKIGLKPGKEGYLTMIRETDFKMGRKGFLFG